MTGRTGKAEQERQNRTDRQNRTGKTGQAEQDRQNRQAEQDRCGQQQLKETCSLTRDSSPLHPKLAMSGPETGLPVRCSAKTRKARIRAFFFRARRFRFFSRFFFFALSRFFFSFALASAKARKKRECPALLSGGQVSFEK